MAGSQTAILVFASFRPKAEEAAEVERILRGMVAPTRAEPGNEIYDLFQRRDDGEGPSFHLFEKYVDAAALDAHRQTAHYKAYRAAIADRLAEPIAVVVLEALDAET